MCVSFECNEDEIDGRGRKAVECSDRTMLKGGGGGCTQSVKSKREVVLYHLSG